MDGPNIGGDPVPRFGLFGVNKMSLVFNLGNWHKLGGIQAVGKNWKVDLSEYKLTVEMKARGLSYEVWVLAWELKHICPVIKMSSCA